MSALPMQQGSIGGLLSGYPQMPMPPNAPSVFASPATQGSNAAADFAALQAASGSDRFLTLWDQMTQKYGSVDNLNQMLISQVRGGQPGQIPPGNAPPGLQEQLARVAPPAQPTTIPQQMAQSAQQGFQLGGLLNNSFSGPQNPGSGVPPQIPPQAQAALAAAPGQPNPGIPQPRPQQPMSMPQMAAQNRMQMGPQQGPPRPVNAAGMSALAQGQQVPGGGPRGGYAPQHINRFLNKQEPASGARDPYPVPLPSWEQANQETQDWWRNLGGLSGLFGVS